MMPLPRGFDPRFPGTLYLSGYILYLRTTLFGYRGHLFALPVDASPQRRAKGGLVTNPSESEVMSWQSEALNLNN